MTCSLLIIFTCLYPPLEPACSMPKWRVCAKQILKRPGSGSSRAKYSTGACFSLWQELSVVHLHLCCSVCEYPSLYETAYPYRRGGHEYRNKHTSLLDQCRYLVASYPPLHSQLFRSVYLSRNHHMLCVGLPPRCPVWVEPIWIFFCRIWVCLTYYLLLFLRRRRRKPAWLIQ